MNACQVYLTWQAGKTHTPSFVLPQLIAALLLDIEESRCRFHYFTRQLLDGLSATFGDRRQDVRQIFWFIAIDTRAVVARCQVSVDLFCKILRVSGAEWNSNVGTLV